MATKKTVTEEQKKMQEDNEVRVRVFVPYIEGGEKEVQISVNDEILKFKKGYTVEIPARFAHALENSNQASIVQMENKEKLKNQKQDW